MSGSAETFPYFLRFVMNYEIKTAGEQLAYFIQDRILIRAAWDKFSDVLGCTGRSDALCDFFHELTVINLTCRIVAAGTSLLRESGKRPARSAIDTSFEKEFLEFMRERFILRPPVCGELFRNAVRAVESARRDPSTTERNRFKGWAQREHPHCYLCGVSLDFTEQDRVYKFTLDHIWPQRFGGDSIPENWLPACGSCNSRKKRDFATWAMPSIQSLILGFDPSENEYTAVDGSQRFALHQLAAKKLAMQRNISLKRAYTVLGPWDNSPRLIDEDDIGDFFNLAIHRATLEVN
jgi:hypothetical protein